VAEKPISGERRASTSASVELKPMTLTESHASALMELHCGAAGLLADSTEDCTDDAAADDGPLQ